ncbi:MAG: restriction endonuclease [Bacteroidetes bacterium]|nr:restriction endonuclease [Bacteroidota bacterium]
MPSKTINRLHFEDLSPSRFEDLCLMIFYRLIRWENIEHLGRVGSDGGIDIRATERSEDDKLETWYVQCKRYKSISFGETKKVIDKIIKKNGRVPDKLLLIVACDVTKKCFDDFQQYAVKKRVKLALLWSASLLEAKLYSEHKDLLFTFFGISMTKEIKNKISSIRKNIRLRSRMLKDFFRDRKEYKREEAVYRPYIRLSYSEAIIHSIYDDDYPDVDEKKPGISPWFKVELYDFYYKGLEVIMRGCSGIIDQHGNWDVIEYGSDFDTMKYRSIRLLQTGRIPFENIVDYDLMGDEYYSGPHIYCEFKNSGMPYEELPYRIHEDGQYPEILLESKRITRK